jgi:hypothetical protein
MSLKHDPEGRHQRMVTKKVKDRIAWATKVIRDRGPKVEPVMRMSGMVWACGVQPGISVISPGPFVGASGARSKGRTTRR